MKEIRQKFLRELSSIALEDLFEELNDVFFFAKNLQSRFVMGNSATVKAFGFKSHKYFIGKSDYDIVTTDIANQYRQADQRVFQTAKPIKNIIEPLPDHSGALKWYSTSKFPLFDSHKKVIGVGVIMKDVSTRMNILEPFEELREVIEYIFKYYSRQIFIEELATLKNISVKQLERNFKKIFGHTPLKYINEHRVKMACIKLKTQHTPISCIAKECGFYDHAHFIRNFKKTMNMTPRQYRQQFK